MTDNPITRIRRQLYQSAWFAVVFLLFIAEFYFIPEDKWQSNLFRVGLLLPFLLVFPWKRIKSRLLNSHTLQVVCLLICSLLLSLSWSTDAEPGMTEKMLYHGLYVTGFVLIGTDLLLRNPAYADRLFYWLGWLILVTGTLSIWWFYREHNFPMERLKAIGQLHHSGFAAILYGLVGLYHFMATPRPAGINAWHRWLPGTLAAGMGLAVIILAQSRGGLVALAVVLLLGGLITRQRRFLVSLVLVALSLLVMALLWSDELLTMVTRGSWDAYRLDIWRQSLALIKEAPLFGHGLLVNSAISTDGMSISHPHNILLSTLLYGGIMSGGLLLLLIGLVLRQGWQSWAATRDIKPLLLTVFGFTYLMTDGYRLISNPVPNWVYFWLPVIWAISRELRDQPHSNRH
jgi:O-antigen ligase